MSIPTKYKIKVDRDLCIGAASCLSLATKTFKLDSDNKAVIISEVRDEIEAIKLAAESCPTRAIIIADADTGNQVYP